MTTDAEIKDLQAHIAVLQQEIAALKRTAASPEPEQPPLGRRAGMLALVGAIAAAGVALPKQASAEIDESDLDGIEDSLNGILNQSIRIGDLLATAFSVAAAIGVSDLGMQILRCLLGSPGGISFNFDACSALQDIFSEHSMTRSPSVQPTMEKVWPADPQRVAVDMYEATNEHYTATYNQVQEAQLKTASLAEAQDMLAAEDVATMEAIAAAAQEGHLIAVEALHAKLTQNVGIRLSHILESLNASQQVRGNMAMSDAWRRKLTVAMQDPAAEPTRIPIPSAQPIGGGGGPLTTIDGG